MNRFLLFLLWWLTRAGLSPAQAPTADVILCANGTEIAGRVLTITPLELRYLPPASADTLRVAAADVFLVRYANGTREVLHPSAPMGPATSPLAGQSEGQRRTLARQDAARCYTDHGAFWGSLGATLYGGPLLGLVAPAVIGTSRVRPANLHAPQPALLSDPVYDTAYRHEAQRHKRSRAWGGYGVGVGAWVVLLGAIAAGSL